MRLPTLTDEDLARADSLFRRALDDGSIPEALTVLGYGEISTALAFSSQSGERIALKRLPPFSAGDLDARVAAYRSLFEEYLANLSSCGIRLVPSELRELDTEEARERVVYCAQPVLPADSLGPAVFRRLSADRETLADHLRTLFETFRRVVDPCVGFDGQLSNWALANGTVKGAWHYLDVTTPLLRDTEGRDRLDADLFLAMLPRVLRPPVRRLLLHSITETYFSARSVALDFLGNLIKERLETALRVGVDVAAEIFDPPITEREVRATYRADARLWEWLLRLRRVDRWWHRRVLRRSYPFLLPGKIER